MGSASNKLWTLSYIKDWLSMHFFWQNLKFPQLWNLATGNCIILDFWAISGSGFIRIGLYLLPADPKRYYIKYGFRLNLFCTNVNIFYLDQKQNVVDFWPSSWEFDFASDIWARFGCVFGFKYKSVFVPIVYLKNEKNKGILPS